MTPAAVSLYHLLRMGAGMIVWASAFIFLYAGYSLACLHLPVRENAGLFNPVSTVLMVFGLAHLAVLMLLLWLWWRRPVARMDHESAASHRFRHWVEGLILALSVLGVVMIAAPVLMVTPCVD